MRKTLTLLALLLYLTLISAQNIAGKIDSTFGNQGISQIGVPNNLTTGTAIFHPDGRIVVSGDQTHPYPQILNMHNFAAAYFSANGIKDVAANNGNSLLECGGLFSTMYPYSLHLLDNDKALLVGEGNYAYWQGGSAGYIYQGQIEFNLFTAGGSCQYGVIRNSNANINTYGRAVEVLANGKFILATEQNDTLRLHFFQGINEFKTIRKYYPNLAANVSPYPLAIYHQADSSILAFLKMGIDSVLIQKILPNGTLDASFGTNGSIGFPNINCLTVKKLADGRSVLYAKNKVIFLNTNMSINKIVNLATSPATSETPLSTSPNAFAIAPNDKIITIGYESNFHVVCYNPDGSLDNTFGAAGRSDSLVHNYAAARASSVLIQGGNKIIVYGINDGFLTLTRYFASDLLSENTNIQTPIPQTHFRVFPNPVENQLNISFELPQNAQVSISLYDLAGKLLQNFEQEKWHNEGEINLSLAFSPHIKAGVYSLAIKINENVQYAKVVKW